MPYSFVIDKEARVIRETWTGRVDIPELIESCKVEWQHPDYCKGLRMISDFRDAYAEITADEILKFASWFSGEDVPTKHAIVISRESGLALASMFTMICDSTRGDSKTTQLYFSRDSAERWIAED
jgi:hypothetical protein